LLFRLLHAQAVGPARDRARTALRSLRAPGRDPDPDQLSRHPPRGELHPPRGLHATRAADGAIDDARFLPLARRDAGARVHALCVRSAREAPRPAHAGAPGGDRMTSSDRYVAAAYMVFMIVLLSYLLIQSRRLARFERQVAQLEQSKS